MDDAIPADTDPDAYWRQVERWRGMTPGERAMLASRLSVAVNRLAIAGILADHPDATPGQLRYELARRRYGRAVADAAFGDQLDT